MYILKRLAWHTHGSIAIIFINCLLILITVLMLKVILPYAMDAENHKEAFESLTGGILVVYIGYGVVLECREHLMEIYGLYPEYKTAFQEHLDKICSDFGVLYLVLGLLGETIVQSLIISDEIINTSGIENYVIWFFCFVMFVTMGVICKHIYRIVEIYFYKTKS